MDADRERGSSIVLFVATLPLLLAFACAILDFGRMVFLSIEFDAALSAACASAQLRPGSIADEDRAREDVLRAAPALAVEDLDVDVVVSFGGEASVDYGHYLWDESTDAFSTRLSHVVSSSYVWEGRLNGCYLTPVGQWVAQAQGDAAAGFSLTSRAIACVDSTVEGGAW